MNPPNLKTYVDYLLSKSQEHLTLLGLFLIKRQMQAALIVL